MDVTIKSKLNETRIYHFDLVNMPEIRGMRAESITINIEELARAVHVLDLETLRNYILQIITQVRP